MKFLKKYSVFSRSQLVPIKTGGFRSFFHKAKKLGQLLFISIGDPGMSKLPNMPQVIDYAHSKAKNDWMDVFLCAQCCFFIGTSLGMIVLAMSFGFRLLLQICCQHAQYITLQAKTFISQRFVLM